MARLQEVFCENLKKNRKRVGLTQEVLAEKIGVTPKYYGVIERGKKFPSVQIIENIADALGVAPYRLFIESAAITESSPTEIIDSYNSYLGEVLITELRRTGREFLGGEAVKSQR